MFRRAARRTLMRSRLAVCLFVLGCGHAAERQSSTPPPVTPPPPAFPDNVECAGNGAYVLLTGNVATYYAGARQVGASACVLTAQAIYSLACVQSASFKFSFAGIPGPPLLGGKSARLDVAGATTLLDCRERRAPAPLPGDSPCARCGPNERCITSPVNGAPMCYPRDRTPPVQ